MSLAKPKPLTWREKFSKLIEDARHYVLCVRLGRCDKKLRELQDFSLSLAQRKSRIEDRRAAEEADWSD